MALTTRRESPRLYLVTFYPRVSLPTFSRSARLFGDYHELVTISFPVFCLQHSQPNRNPIFD